jgi:CCR4-NOT transcriptional complex subunit CAF120
MPLSTSLTHTVTLARCSAGACESLLVPARVLTPPPAIVLSFMSQWGGPAHLQKQPPSTSASPSPSSPSPSSAAFQQSATALDMYHNERASPSPHHQRSRSDSRPSSRPMSMIQTYQPPVMDISADTLPELQRIFTFLNSHSNKLYQEGYFLKFHDTDSRTLGF